MGLLSLFGLGGEGLSEKQIEKIAKLGANPFAQPDVRREQMTKLIRDGSPAAIRGLLARLSVNSSQAIAVEEEKRFVVEELIAMGEKALEPIKAYLAKEQALSFAVEALFGILPKDAAVLELLALLEVYTPDDYRADEQKRQLVHILADEQDARILPKLVPYLLDHSDDVRELVLELFAQKAKAGDPAAAAPEVRAHVGKMLRDEESSPRVAKKAADVALGLEWELPGAGELNHSLAADFFLDKKGIVRRRAKPHKT